MRTGLQANWFTWPEGRGGLADRVARQAQRAEAAGFYSFWVMDHFFQLPFLGGAAENDMLEAYTTLGYVAGLTSRIKLGAMVGGVTYRHPGILVKTATTLDVLSKGRSYFGIGAAWFEDEHVGLGVPFPPLRERFERLDETLRIARQMWRGDDSPFHGQHYSLERPLCVPMPVSAPHPPIMIGGSGEKKTLRLVARYGDACNLSQALLAPDAVAAVRQKLDVLREHCAAEGRAYDDIEKTAMCLWKISRGGGPPEVHEFTVSPDLQKSLGLPSATVVMPTPNYSVAEALEKLEALAEVGLDQVILVEGPAELDYDLLASELIPKMSRFGRALLATQS